MSSLGATSVTVTFAGCGDAFGSGGRYQACIHLRPRIVLTHMPDDMVDHLDQACFETAEDGLILQI